MFLYKIMEEYKNYFKISAVPEDFLKEVMNGITEIKAMIQGDAKEQADNEWLESSEARKMLGVSPKTWQTYRDTRVLPFSQFGRKIYVKRSDIEKFLNDHMVRRVAQ